MITPIILSGGGGTRLWPMSRPECPKQFLALTGEQTMFQLTLNRCSDTSQFAPPIIVANSEHAGIVDVQMEAVGAPEAKILLEPCARNTAPAIALAALAAEPDAPLLVMPSDHVVEDQDAFHRAIAAALPSVEKGWLATFGIAPTGPETGYGYIQQGEALADDTYKVRQFVEKPDASKAAAMLESGDHVWNGGIFLFRADAYLDALARHAPEILSAAKAAMENAEYDGNRIHPDEQAFSACPADSIDYAVMEKSDKVAVIPVSMGWSDVGSWDALYEMGKGTSGANIMEIDGQNNLIRSDGIRVHAVGMEDMIVVASGNDILIVPRGKSQDVKKIVEKLKR